MILLPFLVVGAALSGLVASRAAGTVVLGSELLSGRNAKKKNKEHEQNNKLGLNPEHAIFKAERQKKVVQSVGGDPAVVVAGFSFVEVEFEPDELPDQYKWAAGNYLLTEDELDQLVDALQHGLSSVDIEWLKEISKRRQAEQNSSEHR